MIKVLLIAFFIALNASLWLLRPPAVESCVTIAPPELEQPPSVFERTPMLNTQLYGPSVKLEVFNAPRPPTGYRMLVCIREFDAPAARCYAVNESLTDLKAADFDFRQE